ncbi:hypothetical protein ABZP36_017398 [Zizania latifolia]
MNGYLWATFENNGELLCMLILLSEQEQVPASVPMFCDCYRQCYPECRRRMPRGLCRLDCAVRLPPVAVDNCSKICLTSICDETGQVMQQQQQASSLCR